MSQQETEESHEQSTSSVREKRGRQRMTTEAFITKARRVHGDRYDYSKTHYIGSLTKVTITCPQHGDFEQIPNNHLSGSGCPPCNKGRPCSTNEAFIAKAKLKHGERYIYDNVKYEHSGVKISVTCREHGDFSLTPNGHLNGQGCPECARLAARLTTEEFVEKARLKHGNRYDYDKVQYELTNVKVTITCREHGDFQQKPNDHLSGQGCPACIESKHEKRLAAIFKKYDIPFEREFKLKQFNIRYEYDFYLPLQRVIVEFHGDHHYVAKKFYGGDERLKYTQQCDREKEAYAKAVGLPIVVFNMTTAKLEDDEYEDLVISSIRTAYQSRRNVYPV